MDMGAFRCKNNNKVSLSNKKNDRAHIRCKAQPNDMTIVLKTC